MAAIDDLPPLGEVLRRHGLNPRRALGQNFLLDLNLTARVARASGPLEGATVLEIGPGPGGLTRALLAGGARVLAVERDERCAPALAEVAARHPGRLRAVIGDALALDHAALLAAEGWGGPARVVANLPYNVATPLIVGWLRAEPWPPWWESLTVMVQREVAERLVATPAARADYGRLGVLAGWRALGRIAFDVAPSAFTPPPKVVSSVVHLVPRAAPEAADPAAMEAVARLAFAQRRKMLRQSLRPLGDAPALLAAAGIDGAVRAEAVDVAGFARLARALAARGPLPAAGPGPAAEP